jgi:hypothetical protein
MDELNGFRALQVILLKDVLTVLPNFMFKVLWNVERCFVTIKIYVHNIGSYCIKNGLTLWMLFFYYFWIDVLINIRELIELFISRTYLTHKTK